MILFFVGGVCRCFVANLLLRTTDNGEIDSINCLKNNLNATNNLLETFEKMPERAHQLVERLKEDDTLMKPVWCPSYSYLFFFIESCGTDYMLFIVCCLLFVIVVCLLFVVVCCCCCCCAYESVFCIYILLSDRRS